MQLNKGRWRFTNQQHSGQRAPVRYLLQLRSPVANLCKRASVREVPLCVSTQNTGLQPRASSSVTEICAIFASFRTSGGSTRPLCAAARSCLPAGQGALVRFPTEHARCAVHWHSWSSRGVIRTTIRTQLACVI